MNWKKRFNMPLESSTVRYRPSTNPPYTLHSTTAQVPAIRILHSPQQSQKKSYENFTLHNSHGTSPSYTQQFSKSTASVLRILYSSLQTQHRSSVYTIVVYKYKSSVYATIQYRPWTGPPYTL